MFTSQSCFRLVLSLLLFSSDKTSAFHTSKPALSRSNLSLAVTAKGNVDESSSSTRNGSSSSRREFVSNVLMGSVSAWIATPLLSPQAVYAEGGDTSAVVPKVLVLGGTGLVGSEVVRQLESKGIAVVATSRNGRGGTSPLDFASMSEADIKNTVEKLSSGCTAIISCVGSIGTDKDDIINSGSGRAAAAASADVKKFVYISVAPEVRDFAAGIDFFKPYMAGKLSSENSIKNSFDKEGKSFTIIEPTFIYGGDEFKVNPPRVASGYGQLVESVLSLGPFRAMAKVFPGFIGVALEPPVNVEVGG